eukprot:6203655-Pleurochrysis_carterae.AAC.1
MQRTCSRTRAICSERKDCSKKKVRTAEGVGRVAVWDWLGLEIISKQGLGGKGTNCMASMPCDSALAGGWGRRSYDQLPMGLLLHSFDLKKA